MEIDPSTAARMLDLRIEGERLWPDEELADVLRHQLAAPLVSDLGRFGGMESAGVRVPGRLATFGELLDDAAPPLGLLRLVKEFGKSGAADPDGPVPAEVGTVLYFASIAAALVRHGERMTSLSDESLRDGFAWGIGQPWTDAGIRRLLEQGLSCLARSGS